MPKSVTAKCDIRRIAIRSVSLICSVPVGSGSLLANRSTIGRARLFAIASTLLCLASPASLFASCQLVTIKTITGDPHPSLTSRVTYVAAPTNGATVAIEGLAERLSDVLIYDSGAGAACFQSGNVLTLVYDAALTTAPGLDIFDSNGVSALAASIATPDATTVRISVTHAGTAGNLASTSSGAALRIRNLRANVSAMLLGDNLQVHASATASGTLSGGIRNVGYVTRTITSGAVTTSAGSGAQNAGGTLSTPAVFSLTENFSDALRVPGNTGVAGDITTGATSLILDVANTLPPGVTVTFPPALINSGLSFALRQGGSCSGPAQCFAIYDTTANAAGNGSLTVTTAATPRAGSDGSTPAIGVQIASNSGVGTVTLRAIFGPGIDGGTNDDINSGGIPRYVASTSATVPTRAIFNTAWFTIAPGIPVLALSPANLAFGSMLVGTGKEQTVVLSNMGTQLLQIGNIAISGADFRLDNRCPTTLTALSSCELVVQFSPTAPTVRNGTLTIVSTAAGSPHVVELTGQGQIVSGVPAITSLSPNSAQAGAGWTRLVVNGANFAPGAIVNWNGVGLGTTVLSDTQLAAGIPPANLSAIGTAAITVVNPSPGGGVSAALTFTIFSGPLPAKSFVYYVPHVVTGGGYSTRFTFVDLGAGSNNIDVHYVSQSGELLAENSFDMPSGGTLRIETPPADRKTPAIAEWAVIGADAPLAVHVVVEQSGEETAPANGFGFTDCSPADSFAIPAEFAPAPAGAPIGRTMGLAIANPSPNAVSAELRLVDASGVALAAHSFSLLPFGQLALDLQQLDEFRAALPPSNFVGSVTGIATAPVCALALLDNYGPFLVAPVVRKPR